MIPALQLPQPIAFVLVEVHERARGGQQFLASRGFEGTFRFGYDVADAVFTWLSRRADKYDPALTTVFWRPSPEEGAHDFVPTYMAQRIRS